MKCWVSQVDYTVWWLESFQKVCLKFELEHISGNLVALNYKESYIYGSTHFYILNIYKIKIEKISISCYIKKYKKNNNCLTDALIDTWSEKYLVKLQLKSWIILKTEWKKECKESNVEFQNEKLYRI